MKREISSIKPDIMLHRMLANLCLFTLFISTVAFLYLFFYQDFSNAYKKFKQSRANSAPVFDNPEIAIPKPVHSLNSNAPKENIQTSTVQDSDPSSKVAEKIFVAYELGDTSLASRLIADFLSEYPDSLFRHKVRLIGAKLMNDKGDYTGALNYIQKILSDSNLSNEDYSEAVLLMGAIAREKKQYDSYIQSFLEQAYFRAQEPTKSKLAFYLGYLLLHKGDFQSALSYFNNVIGEDGVLGRADLYAAQLMRPETINSLESFLEQYPASKNYEYAKNSFIKESQLQAQALISRGYVDSAMRYYNKIIKLFPLSKEGDQARIDLATIHYQQKNYIDAERVLQEVLKNEDVSKDHDALFNLGKVSFEMNKQEQALGYFRSLVELYPTSPHIAKAQEWQYLISESLRN